MATILQTDAPTPTRVVMKARSSVEAAELPSTNARGPIVLFEPGYENIVSEVADTLGQSYKVVGSKSQIDAQDPANVVGICSSGDLTQWTEDSPSRTSIYFHCVDSDKSIDEGLSNLCDFEYLYTQKPFDRRDLARYLSFILGQNNIHANLSKKARTFMISTTFPDVQQGLPNLDIISVGADAIELRVDLLKEPISNDKFAQIPSIDYVGRQVMILRQRTELPIVYTTRCTKENGRFPMDDPELFFKYLAKAIKWGCEYIDVELWLPETIRRRLSLQKGSSRIISAFHDFTRTYKWTSPDIPALFRKGTEYSDIVKMIILIDNEDENYQLEQFRSAVTEHFPDIPFSGLNMGPVGQMSRAFNKVFTPITHPLLPMIAAPGQLSAAEINTRLHSMGQIQKRDFYCIGNLRSAGQALFIDKCFNELSLPHNFTFVERTTRNHVCTILKRPAFGGAYINPPVATAAALTNHVSDAAREVGQIDTVVASPDGKLVGENTSWKGIRATLCRDFVPSAYQGRVAVILASAEADATAAIVALKNLGIGPIYTIGFNATGPLSRNLSPIRNIDDLKRLDDPMVILTALAPERAMSVSPLLKHYSNKTTQPSRTSRKVFVDLANGNGHGNLLTTAATLGFVAYGAADVGAWTIVETLRLLIGQNVPYDFVRLAAGRSLH